MAKIAEVQEVSLSLLRPYESNAKIHGKGQIEKLKRSINEFGFLNPCLIDRDFNLIAGHGRVMAATELGWESVPCVFVEGLTEAQRRAYILADNRLAELATWDEDIVQSELKALDASGFDVSVTGFELNIEAFEVNEDGYEEPEAVQRRTRRGDVFQLGKHRLMCGDSTSSADMDTLFGGELADMVFTDPPYGVSIGSKNKAINAIDPGRGGASRRTLKMTRCLRRICMESLSRPFQSLESTRGTTARIMSLLRKAANSE